MKIDHEQPVPGCVPKPNPTTSHGITEAYTLTDEDERILAKTVPAYTAGVPVRGCTSQRPGTNEDGDFVGPTADEILADHGVTWSRGSARYYALVREIIARHQAATPGPGPRPGPERVEPEPRACEHCGEDMPYRASEGPYQYRQRRFCDQECWHAARRERRAQEREDAA